MGYFLKLREHPVGGAAGVLHAFFSGERFRVALEIGKQRARDLPVLARRSQIATGARQIAQFQPRTSLDQRLLELGGEPRAEAQLGRGFLLGACRQMLVCARKQRFRREHGINGLTRGLAGSLGPHRIRINTVSPGWVMTERQITLWLNAEGEAAIQRNQCLPDKLQAADVARMVLFLASADATMCTAQEFKVDAGWN